MTDLDIRFRVASPELLALPWRQPLAEWDPTSVALRDIPVGPSRHLVRFVEADRRLWAIKLMPRRIAAKEYDVLRELERRSLAAVRVAGVVRQPDPDAALLVTHYLERSWQYRRLLMRVPASMRVHRGRLFQAMAMLLVDLHRNGIYWGDCSLANTLFMRDGQSIQAWLVDAETAEVHPSLSDGQRRGDLEIMVENVAGGLLDVAARREEPPEAYPGIIAEARGVEERYEEIWQLLHDEPVIGLGDSDQIESRVRRLNEVGYALDEVRLEPTTPPDDQPDQHDQVRLKVGVGWRRFHSEQLRSLTGLDAGEGQATILLEDIREHRLGLQHDLGHEVPPEVAARHWVLDVFTPRSEAAHRAVRGVGDVIQAYCDLLEVRWLLSEEAGGDVGDDIALEALAARVAPSGSAADLGFVEMATEEVAAITPELIEQFRREAEDEGGPR